MNEPKERTALYRIRGEAGLLLYIGISNHPGIRWNGHLLEQPWWGELRTLTVEWYDSRPEAEDAEKAAIRAEQPKYNVTYLKPTGVGRERKPLEVIPVERGVAELDPRDDDEDLLTFDEVRVMTQLGPTTLRNALARTGGPAGFLLGREKRFRRREIRQWIADIEASQRQVAA